MSLDHLEIFNLVRELAASDRPVSDCMSTLIAKCAEMVPHADWDGMHRIDYDSDLTRLRSWVSDRLRREPPTAEFRGLWFGLFNPVYQGRTTADMNFAGTSMYDPADEALLWTGQQKYRPAERYAHSTSLQQIYDLAYASSGALGNTAEWPLGLGFVATAVRTLLTPEVGQLACTGSAAVGVAVGFDDGDMFKLGELTRSDFRRDLSRPAD